MKFLQIAEISADISVQIPCNVPAYIVLKVVTIRDNEFFKCIRWDKDFIHGHIVKCDNIFAISEL